MSPQQPRVHPEIDQLAPFVAKLRAQRADLAGRFREERNQTVDREIGEPMDAADQGTAENNVSSISQMSERHQRAVRDIDDALIRIESGDYGFCETCDEPIDPRRLEASPAALRCVACEAIHERETETTHRPTF